MHNQLDYAVTAELKCSLILTKANNNVNIILIFKLYNWLLSKFFNLMMKYFLIWLIRLFQHHM